MAEEERRDSDPFREGLRTVTGILGALKETIEETFDDLRDRGDLSPERAREAARSTVRKAQDSFDEMRDRLDFVPRREFDELRAQVASLEARLAAHTDSGLGGHAAESAGPASAAGAPPAGEGFSSGGE